MKSNHPSRWTLVLLAATFLWCTTAIAESDWDAAEKKWAKGPVSYLSTEAEEKAYKKAKTPEDRAALIAAFWELRNPREGEVPNLFRERFYQRVESADTLLREKGVPAGWKSDLARVLVLLGQPDRQLTEAPQIGSGAAAEPTGPSRGATSSGDSDLRSGQEEQGIKLKLTYEDLTQLGLPANLELEFQKEGLGFRLETRVDLGTIAVRGLDREILAQVFPAGEEPLKEEALSLKAEPETVAAADLAVMATQRRMLMEVLDGAEPQTAIPFDVSTDLYKAKAGQTYVAISLAIDKTAHDEASAQGALHPVAALRDTSDPENLFLYDTDTLFAPSDGNASAGEGQLLRFQAGDGVKPGTYTLVAGWVNEDGDVAGMRREELEVPDFSAAAVQISSITLAESWETTDEAGGDLKRPYILGNRKVIPKVTPRFVLNGDLALYYQIYNVSEEGGGPDLRISYHVYRKRGTRFTKAATVPPMNNVKELVQIYELSLMGWPLGEYKIKVNVTDNRNGAFGEREVLFHIE